MLEIAASILLTAVAADAGSLDAGVADAGRADAGVATDGGWTLSQKLSPGSRDRDQLIRLLTAGPHKGDAGFTAAEVNALLDDPRAQLIYFDKTVSIVAPSMLVRQRHDHLDLMKMFLKPERLTAGAEFAQKQKQYLDAAESRWSVPREAIIAILMWESKLGTITGEYFTFNAFVSQAYFIDEANQVAMSNPDEAKQISPAAQKERVAKIRSRALLNLETFLFQCKARGIDPLTVKGSWAGALGFPQFMPASLVWAEDGDGDGKIDLFTFPDAIVSIGRYLHEHGWSDDRQKAVWEYNHEDAYVQGVLAYTDALHERLHPDAGTPKPKKK